MDPHDRDPMEISREQVLLCDAADMLIRMCRVHYSGLREAARLVADTDGYPSPDIEARLFAEAGALVGDIRRLGLVVAKLRGDDDVRLARKAFRAAVKTNKTARDYLEHLDERIPKMAAGGQAAFGGIAWGHLNSDVGNVQIRMVVPGTAAVAKELAGWRVPGPIWDDPIDHFMLTILGETYDLTASARAVEALSERLGGWTLRREAAAAAGRASKT